MTVLLIAGTGVILAGLAAIGFGIPVKEFGFGNTLILTGTVGVCTGLIMISLALVARDLRNALAQASSGQGAVRLPRRELNLAPVEQADDEATVQPAPNPLLPRGTSRPEEPPAPEPNVPPWQDEVLRDRERMVAAAGAPEADEPKRRNLLFSSSRREREKDRSEAAVAQALELDLTAPEPASPSDREPPRGFDDAWPAADRSRQDRPTADRPRFSDAIRQAARASATHGDQLPDPSQIPDRDEPAPAEPQRAPGVTVLKSGVVDGMAYSLYSDGSIEAQMPEGLMRFASIDELREHLESRT